MRLEDMLPAAELMDEIGYHSVEVWGGATFDVCLRFLDEDPWERLRRLRRSFRRTKLQMLLRGQNLVGYRHYADDVVQEFIKRAVAHGIDIIRIFDALNDPRNMETAMVSAKDEGAHVQAALCYTISPRHNLDYFVRLARTFKEMGADSLCIKDMAGLLLPAHSYALVRRLKEEVGLPVQLHCHYTSGMASMTYLKGIEAGADVVDTACAALALGASQPPTEAMVAALQGTPYDTGLDLQLLAGVSEHFKKVRARFDVPIVAAADVDTAVLRYQVPGGMISNLAAQLEEQGALHLLPQVLEEVPRVRADLGYPPLGTPSSQIVGAQAVANVLLGERYKVVSAELKNYLRGLYGRPPGEIHPELLQKVLGEEKPVEVRPADLIPPQLPGARQEAAGYLTGEEDLLSYVLFPSVALNFFKRRRGLLPPMPRHVEPPQAQRPPAKEAAWGGKGLAIVDASLAWREGDVIVYPA